MQQQQQHGGRDGYAATEYSGASAAMYNTRRSSRNLGGAFVMAGAEERSGVAAASSAALQAAPAPAVERDSDDEVSPFLSGTASDMLASLPSCGPDAFSGLTLDIDMLDCGAADGDAFYSSSRTSSCIDDDQMDSTTPSSPLSLCGSEDDAPWGGSAGNAGANDVFLHWEEAEVLRHFAIEALEGTDEEAMDARPARLASAWSTGGRSTAEAGQSGFDADSEAAAAAGSQLASDSDSDAQLDGKAPPTRKRKLRAGQRPGGRSGALTVEILEKYYSQPLADASRALGLSATMLKKVCRNIGIRRWPHRQLASVDKTLVRVRRRLETQQRLAARSGGGDQKVVAALEARVADLEGRKAAICRAASCGSSPTRVKNQTRAGNSIGGRHHGGAAYRTVRIEGARGVGAAAAHDAATPSAAPAVSPSAGADSAVVAPPVFGALAQAWVQEGKGQGEAARPELDRSNSAVRGMADLLCFPSYTPVLTPATTSTSSLLRRPLADDLMLVQQEIEQLQQRAGNERMTQQFPPHPVQQAPPASSSQQVNWKQLHMQLLEAAAVPTASTEDSASVLNKLRGDSRHGSAAAASYPTPAHFRDTHDARVALRSSSSGGSSSGPMAAPSNNGSTQLTGVDAAEWVMRGHSDGHGLPTNL